MSRVGPNHGGVHGWMKSLFPHVQRGANARNLTVAYHADLGKIRWSGDGFNVLVPSNANLEQIIARIKEAKDTYSWGAP